MSEKRTERFARLEVDRTVLYLDDDVVSELSVKRSELVISLAGPVRTFRRIYEGSPHYDAVVWPEGVCKHVRTLRMSAAEVLRSGKSF